MRNRTKKSALLLVFLIAFAVQLAAQDSADALFQRGMELAQKNRWNEAATAFKTGEDVAPRDKRFPLELAGIAFKQKDLNGARTHLHRALSLDPDDSYGNDFLATIYFLEGNNDAALKYWNRLGRPHIERLRVEGNFKISPALLDRAFTFAPADLLKRQDLETSNLRVQQFEIFSRHQFALTSRDDGKFDLVFRGIERNGWGASKWDGLLSTFRGVFYQTLYAEIYNLRGTATNSLSLWRWDADKQRLNTSFSGVPAGNPGWRYRLDLDLRNENWVQTFGLESIQAGFQLENIINERATWVMGAQVSKRNFNRLFKTGDPLFSEGLFVKSRLSFGYQLLKSPENRLMIQSRTSADIGRDFSNRSSLFSQVQMDVDATWHPNTRSEDGRLRARFRAGGTFGSVPIDELFSLGVDRDSDLWLRAHSGLGEKKGHNPFGEHYVLINLEGDTVLYDHTWFRFLITPFVDLGHLFKAHEFETKWLIDTGLEAKVRVMGGLTAAVIYGKDLRSGRNAVYFHVVKSHL